MTARQDEKDMEYIVWLNGQVDGHATSMKDEANGYDICKFLIEITESKGKMKRVMSGDTEQERRNNFKLVHEIYNEMSWDFTYDMEKLIDGDRHELRHLIQDLAAIVNEADAESEMNKYQEHGTFNLDRLMEDLEADLRRKYEEIRQVMIEVEEVAEERNFYLDKLLKSEKVCDGYSHKDAEPIINVLSLSASHFERV